MIKTGWVAGCCLGLAGPALAADAPGGEAGDSWRFSGFYTLAATHVEADGLFLRDLSHLSYPQTESTSLATDSRLGVQLGGPVLGQLSASVQLLAADHVNYRLGDGVQWAYLRYPLGDNFAVRVGRLGADMFMLSDYRSVGYAYPWARPVQDYYGMLPLLFFDGADFRWTHSLAGGELSAKLELGTTQGSFGNFRLHARDITSGVVEWQGEDWRLRGVYGSFVYANDPDFQGLRTGLSALAPLWPDGARLAGDMSLAGKRLHFAALGAEYNPGDWWAQAEAGQMESGAALLGKVRMGYVSVGRHFGDWLPFLSLSAVRSQQPPVTAAPLPMPLARSPAAQGARSAALDVVNQNYFRQHSVTLGVRWDFRPRTALKLQWNHILAQPGGRGLWGDCNACNQSGLNGQVWTLSLDGVF